ASPQVRSVSRRSIRRQRPIEGTGQMIVIGTDTHKRTHTCGAVSAATGQLAGELTAQAREPGFRELLAWGRSLDEERIWAIEDCRHVPAGALDRMVWLDRL